MNNPKPLIIDKRDKVKGLFTYCQKCQLLIDNRICGNTKKRLSTCKNTDKHMFKAIVSIPGTDGAKRKTKVFKTRDIQEASRLKYEFVNELIGTDYQSTNILTTNNEISKPTLLIECMAMYIGYLNNEGVAAHKVKIRTTNHIKDIERFFRYFCLSLKENNVDHTLITIYQLNEKAVALLHNYIIDILNYKNKTYNKFMGAMRQFVNWLMEKRGYDLKNHFIGVSRRSEVIDKTIVSKSEFKKLLSVLDPEKGMKEYSTGERKNMYRTWLSKAFRLALETGLRREEFMSIKYNDIVLDEKGVPTFIKIENFKVNRINGVSGTENATMKHIPITKGLRTLLDELDYKTNKGSDNYIIAKEEKTTLKTRIDVISKAFTHYWQFTAIEKKAQLKHLRKTYLTALVQQFGEKANLISSHSGIDVLKKHYVNDQELIKATNDFSVF
jgi:integrase